MAVLPLLLSMVVVVMLYTSQPCGGSSVEDSTAPMCQVPAGCRCAPGIDCYPSCFDRLPWASLNASVEGRLVGAEELQASWEVDSNAAVHDPIFVTSQPGSSHYSGFLARSGATAWSSTENRSRRAVLAESVADVQYTVKFAKSNNVRLAIKNTGHDFFGRGFASGSLLLWTHRLTAMTWQDLQVCGEAVPMAVTAGAGVQFWQLYSEAQARNRFIIGGTCATVGHVGFTSGGGYGDMSKFYGSGASNVVQAEVVLADGSSIVATTCNEHKDLLRAIRGGGGGSFGVVTSLTYRSYEQPEQRGNINARVVKAAHPDGSFSLALQEFLNHLRDHVVAKGMLKHLGGFLKYDGQFGIIMSYVGITEAECTNLFSEVSEYLHIECSATGGPIWPGWQPVSSKYGVKGEWVNSWQAEQASGFHVQTHNRYVQQDAIASPEATKRFSDMLERSFKSLHGGDGLSSSFLIAFNYGLGGSGAASQSNFGDTSVHPAVKTAIFTVKLDRYIVAHIPVGDGVKLPGASAYIADQDFVQQELDSVLGATAGSYVNEAAFDEPDWRFSFWGDNYEFLSRVKHTYDSDDLLICHHCVGSERWDSAGNCKVNEKISNQYDTPVATARVPTLIV